jgi:DNA-binding NarL/FixJ family response regulator
MLTVFDESDKIFDSILAGANGYLLKDEKPTKLYEAIEEALDDGAPMSPAIANKALRLIRGGTKEVLKPVEFGLTAREVEILDYIAAGKNYTVIADALFISPKTVRKHIENIYKKLQVHNKVEAIQLAQRHGML